MSDKEIPNMDTQDVVQNPQGGKISEEERLKLINETAKAVKEANKAAYGAEEQQDLKDEKVMLVAFEVGNEHYAVSIDMIKEVVSCPPIAPIPQMPKYVEGVANVRGNVLAILDLSVKFGLSENGDKGKFVFVIKSEDQHFAIRSKSVPDTMTVSKKDIGLASNIISQSSLGLNYVRGIIKKEGKMIVWIDLLDMISIEGLSTSA